MKDEDWIEEIGGPACADCRFWDSDIPADDPESDVAGDCRRYPKTRRKKSYEWCGEFELDPADRAKFKARP